MRTKTKKLIQKISLYLWAGIGILLLLWTASWFIYTNKSRELGEVIKFNPEIKKTCRIYPQDNNTEGFLLLNSRE